MLPFQAPPAAAPSPSFMELVQEYVLSQGVNVIWALATLVIGWWVARLAGRLVRRLFARRHLDDTLVGFFANLAYITVLTLVVISALERLGIRTTSFVAVLGAAGLAIGFALQGSLSNFAAGVLLIFFRPFRAGDQVDVAGTNAVVVEVQIFSTVLRTPDNKLVIVPNSTITGTTIVNYSAHPTRRVDLVFGIGYGDDLRRAKEVLLQAAADDPRVLKEPPPIVAVAALAESSVNLVCRAWVRTPDYLDVSGDLLERVKIEFDAHGISIPFPQRDVHLHQVA